MKSVMLEWCRLAGLAGAVVVAHAGAAPTSSPQPASSAAPSSAARIACLIQV